MRGSKFVSDRVDLLHYDVHKIRGGSYIDSPEWLKNEKATINPKNNDDKCFKYTLTVALNYEQIKSHAERVSKAKVFIDLLLKEMDFPSHEKDWKNVESNNKSNVRNILYLHEEMRHEEMKY